MKIFKRTFLILVAVCLLIGTVSGCKSSKVKTTKLVDALDQIQGMEDYAPTGEMPRIFSEKVTYVVKKIDWDGNDGIAKVEVTTPDLSEIISSAINDAVSELGVDDYDALLADVKERIESVLNSDDMPMCKKSVEMDAEKTDDGYELIANDEFKRIISGNIEEIFMNAIVEGMTNAD